MSRNVVYPACAHFHLLFMHNPLTHPYVHAPNHNALKHKPQPSAAPNCTPLPHTPPEPKITLIHLPPETNARRAWIPHSGKSPAAREDIIRTRQVV